MKIKVVMLGPGEGVVGGISSLVETILPYLSKEVHLKYFSTVRHRPLKDSGKITLQNIFIAFSQYIRFLPVMFCYRPHIIHLHTSQGVGWLKDTYFILIAKLCRCRIVLHVHAADFEDLFSKYSHLLKNYTCWTMGLSDAVIAVSEEWSKRLSGIVGGDKVHTYKNCISIDDAPHQCETYSESLVNILFLGSVGPRKGVYDLLEAIAIMKLENRDIQVWIGGYEEGPGELQKTKTKIQELNLQNKCALLGFVVGDKKRNLLKNAHIFVLPSYNEGLPIAILEAMAAGLAIVSTPVGGIPEVVRDGYNGFLVMPGAISELSEKLEALVGNPYLCRSMGKRSRTIAETELDVIPYTKRLVTLYYSLIEATSTGEELMSSRK